MPSPAGYEHTANIAKRNPHKVPRGQGATMICTYLWVRVCKLRSCIEERATTARLGYGETVGQAAEAMLQ